MNSLTSHARAHVSDLTRFPRLRYFSILTDTNLNEIAADADDKHMQDPQIEVVMPFSVPQLPNATESWHYLQHFMLSWHATKTREREALSPLAG